VVEGFGERRADAKDTFAGILAFGMMRRGLAMAQAPIAGQPAAGYQPKFAGDPARSEAEAQALGYMRVVLRAENTTRSGITSMPSR